MKWVSSGGVIAQSALLTEFLSTVGWIRGCGAPGYRGPAVFTGLHRFMQGTWVSVDFGVPGGPGIDRPWIPREDCHAVCTFPRQSFPSLREIWEGEFPFKIHCLYVSQHLSQNPGHCKCSVFIHVDKQYFYWGSLSSQVKVTLNGGKMIEFQVTWVSTETEF